MSFGDIMCSLMQSFYFFYGTLFLSKGGERFLTGLSMHHRVQREKKKQGEARKTSLRGCRAQRSYKKAVPKGAQRKFSAQKSFLRECRAYSKKSTLIPPKYKAKREKSMRYRRNRRRRSSKDVPKGMQNLQRKVSADTPKNKR
jgi:hypothetical protein